MQFLKFLYVVLSVLPKILKTVQYVEQIYKGETGEEKKRAAMSLLSEWLSGRVSDEKRDALVNVLDKGIDFVVAILNAFNLWRS